MENFTVEIAVKNYVKSYLEAKNGKKIILEEKKNVLLVPEAAVVYDKQRKTSLEVPDATNEKGRRQIAAKLGISNGVKTELIAGLKEGDKVILQ